MFPLRATGSRQLLPHVNGSPVLGVLWADPTPRGSSVSLAFSVQVAYLSSLIPHRLGAKPSLWVRVSPSVPSRPRALRCLRVQESMGSPKFFDASLHACHALMTPAGLWNLTKTIPLRGLLANVNDRRLHLVSSLSGLYQTSGRCGLPYGLHGSLCTLQTFRSVRRYRLSSYGSATLGTGGRLDLTRQGLSPCKKRQACLGAHAYCASAADGEADRPTVGAGLGVMRASRTSISPT